VNYELRNPTSKKAVQNPAVSISLAKTASAVPKPSIAQPHPELRRVGPEDIRPGLGLRMAVIGKTPSDLEAQLGLKFREAGDPQLGRFKWAVIQTPSGRQFGLQHFTGKQSDIEVLVDERAADLTALWIELMNYLTVDVSFFTWVHPDISNKLTSWMRGFRS